MTMAERLWSKVEKTDGCWNWIGSLMPNGYGNISIAGYYLPHRLSWALAHGDPPKGLDIDHLCRNRRCVRPDHLRLATRRQNLLAAGSESRAALKAAQTQCIHGHSFDEANTHIRPNGTRACRACGRQRQRDALQPR